MKAKRLVFIIFINVLFSAFSACYGQENLPGETGRYLLFQGSYRHLFNINSEATESEEKGVFKIDTKTGRTWIYQKVSSKKGDKLDQMSAWVDTEIDIKNGVLVQ